VAPERFDLYLVNVDPAEGKAVRRTRRCVVVSPDEMNGRIRTVIVAPVTTEGRPYPTRVPFSFNGTPGQVVLDQLRTVERGRLLRKLGSLSPLTAEKVLGVLREMFGA
jgi:mRNA interferase MazF